MSGDGRPQAEPVDAADLTLGIVATRWNESVVEALLARSVAAAQACKISAPTVVRVAGALELPVVAQQLAATHDAVVCLGAVIRGGTPHFDYVCQVTTSGIGRVALDTGVPVGDGVLTCDTVAQALDRCGLPDSAEDKGWEATVAALDAAVVLRRLRHHGSAGSGVAGFGHPPVER